jgi:diphosphomevalonate decarboxylase
MVSATAIAHPNIAFIKYWGNRDNTLRLPLNGSISMNLDGLFTQTTVTWNHDQGAGRDTLNLNGVRMGGKTLQRISSFLDHVRQLAHLDLGAEVVSESNFPSGAGIASSASAFAALSLAATRAADLDLDSASLSRLARLGSGSACRSIPSGFVEWEAGTSNEASYAISIAPPEHWSLVDVIAIVSTDHKTTSSSDGHILACTSPLQSARVDDAPRRLDLCRRALLERDFSILAEIIEADSNLMHAVMLTSSPPLLYWQAATLTVMKSVQVARACGLQVCYTIDAGPNVHVICTINAMDESVKLLSGIPGVREVRVARVGGPARLVKVE